MQNYESLLPVGKRNSISAFELAKIIGFESTQSVVTDVLKARLSGQIICSCNRGYYLPVDSEELDEFICRTQNRKNKADEIISFANKKLKELQEKERDQIEIRRTGNNNFIFSR